MKKAIVMGLALCLAVSAFAGIGIEWSAPNMGIYLTDGTNPEAYDTLALGKTDVLWQLIFSTDDVKDPIDLDNASGGYVSGNDQVLKDRTIPQDTSGTWDGMVTASDDTSWLACGINMGGDQIVYANETWETAGYVYQRVFGGTPDEGVNYFESGIEPLSLAYDPASPQTMQIFSIDSESQGAVLSEQIPGGVPEPATMSLLGLGALAMVLRRKLRK